jgi:hypothetical protein
VSSPGRVPAIEPDGELKGNLTATGSLFKLS